ncbi:sulfatase-like hydrolase/transferase [Thauera sp. SDU_THAU2]|uniref:sulfatase-like hydrolase/transferase n=1 Tax=Thauera sp. SDU_THAU2 TaxID=3136633 RepID=UPI00311E15CD
MFVSDRRQRALYWFLTWIVFALHLGRFFDFAAPSGLLVYQLALVGSYALLFVAPVWLIVHVAGRFAPRLAAVLAVALAGVVQIALFGDHMLWTLYGFHLNGFVWNILTTPGGIAALGSSASTERDFALLAAGFLVLQVLVFFAARVLARGSVPAPRLAWVLPLFLVVTVGERLGYAVSHFYGYTPLLENAQRVPFYQPLTMRGLFEKQFGWERPQRLKLATAKLDGSLRYPQARLRVEPPARPLNVVWLVAESWRADTLDPRVMPQTHALAERAQHFTHHFSGGNGTRIGVFSQFYSLPANLWFPVLDARIGSPLIQVLQNQDYQIKLFTSARFTYPEFDKTVFVDVPREQMVEDSEGETWMRDRRNVDRLIEFVDQRDPSRPFMTFLFFESPHANYNFPPESVIESGYLEDFSYADMELRDKIGGIHKRYINAVHHLDSQLGKLMAHLERRGLLEDTLVVITGDHGEEFMEKGRWGHNSTFVDEQVRVPLLLWVPGREPRRIDARTSHADLLPTILPLLGVTNPPSDYAIGHSLFDPQPNRVLLAGDWDRLAFLGEDYKLVLPFGSGSFTAIQVSGADDRTLADESAVLRATLPTVQGEMGRLRRFLGH